MTGMPAEIVADLLADRAACYRAVSSRDDRWDGRLFLGVVSTGVYCRPSCPARTPLERHCRYYASAAAAVAAGFRACRRCRPDAVPGTRDHDHRGDLAARALRLIRDGVVDEAGVGGLAARLHVSERHLHRVLLAEVGVGALRLAMSRRAQTARILVEQSRVSMTEAAYAAGFSSVRQFNDVMRAEYGCPPSALRRREVGGSAGARREGRQPMSPGSHLTLSLRYRQPYAAEAVWAYLRARLIPGVEAMSASDVLTRGLDLPGGPGRVLVERPADGVARVMLDLSDLSDLGRVVSLVRRWLDLDADPVAVDGALCRDAGIRALVSAVPGMRVPGCVDGFELAARAVVGQQVSVSGARTVLGRLAAEFGQPGVFPSAQRLAAARVADLRSVGLTERRARTLVTLACRVADGSVVLGPGGDRAEIRARLLEIAGIGPWTAHYVALRALGDPDAWPGSDLVLARRVERDGLAPARWRPWRGYAAMHLWTAESTSRAPGKARRAHQVGRAQGAARPQRPAPAQRATRAQEDRS